MFSPNGLAWPSASSSKDVVISSGLSGSGGGREDPEDLGVVGDNGGGCEVGISGLESVEGFFVDFDELFVVPMENGWPEVKKVSRVPTRVRFGAPLLGDGPVVVILRRCFRPIVSAAPYKGYVSFA